jgi:hypothetical protein
MSRAAHPALVPMVPQYLADAPRRTFPNPKPSLEPPSGAPVVHAFLAMRARCGYYCGKSLEWNTRECAHRGNDYGGSTCCMSGCPILLQEADAKGVR